MIELDDHPFFVGCQFHPEFKSRPQRPAPLFRGFIAAALERAGGEDAAGNRPSLGIDRSRRALVSAAPTDREHGPSAAVGSLRPAAARELRVEVVFGEVDERHAQLVAAEMIARAHELANRPEHECDVDVSVQLGPARGGSGADSADTAVLTPVADPGDRGGVPTDGHLAPRAGAGQSAASR